MRVGRVSLAVVMMAIACGCSSKNPSPPKTGAIGNTWDLLIGETASKAVRLMEDQKSADNRRKGIYELVRTNYGQTELYCKRYRQIAQTDKDYTVRAAAVRACNWARDKNASQVFLFAMNDESELVRWEAAKALVNLPDPGAIPHLTRAVGNVNESRNVRVASAEALKHYRDPNVARALANTLEGKDFGVAWYSLQSLRAITGVDYKYSEQKWLEYLSGLKKPLG